MMRFERISAKELDGYLGRKDVCVIDLRSPDEFVMRHIKGAINIPYHRIREYCMFPGNMTLVFYCDRGAVSMAVAREMAEKGYETRTVNGGFLAYHGGMTESFR